MFSYAFAIKLTDRNINKDNTSTSFKTGSNVINITRKENDVILISSDGYSSSEDALKEMVNTIIKTKIILVTHKISPLDWFSFNTMQRHITELIGSIFEQRNIVPISYKPQFYETKRLIHWPGATPAVEEFDPTILNALSLPDEEFNYGTGQNLEALNVLSLCLSDRHAKSKLILAMTAIEILIDRQPIEAEMAEAIQMLKKKINKVDTKKDIKDRLSNILGSAKTESISKAGERLVKDLLGDSKAKEFKELYKIRSELVHGNALRLSIDLSGHGDIEKYAESAFGLALALTLKYQK
ncbi:hypothetical protein VH86_21035 [Pantoea sp. BL1]|uniref:HEPN domain-containing protein n=1 Tax=Pantoea sp. BL1 TaxID=1628190 RepID=UPI0005F895DE|nr:HEPN domain-containing protein [Pantoea sp. BL1]KJV46412.1 hypothetical protein VH86_21035 [Pantoea sp. BL1]